MHTKFVLISLDTKFVKNLLINTHIDQECDIRTKNRFLSEAKEVDTDLVAHEVRSDLIGHGVRYGPLINTLIDKKVLSEKKILSEAYGSRYRF